MGDREPEASGPPFWPRTRWLRRRGLLLHSLLVVCVATWILRPLPKYDGANGELLNRLGHQNFGLVTAALMGSLCLTLLAWSALGWVAVSRRRVDAASLRWILIWSLWLPLVTGPMAWVWIMTANGV